MTVKLLSMHKHTLKINFQTHGLKHLKNALPTERRGEKIESMKERMEKLKGIKKTMDSEKRDEVSL